MMIAARESFAAARRRWTNPYVTDGLIAMWDGIWNAGPGVHDANATTWVDLIGGLKMTGMSPEQVKGDYMYSDGVHVVLSPALAPMESFTIETVVTHVVQSSAWFHIWAVRSDNNSLGWPGTTGHNLVWKYFGNRLTAVFDEGTISVFANGTAYGGLARNGGVRSTTSGSHLTWGTSQLQWSSCFGLNRGTLHNHCIRIYSRALTADEFAANHAIDKERFGLP